MEKKLVASRILTPDGTLLWSRFTHDYVEYTDANGETYMIDGGPSSGYIRTSVNKERPFTRMMVFNDAPWIEQREVILRGTFNNLGERVWVPLSKLSNDHVLNLTKETDNPRYLTELAHRKKNDIFIPEHDYENDGVSNIIKNYKGI